jgi:hypothetical protein
MHCSKLNTLAVAMQVNCDAVAAIPIERMMLLSQQYWTIARSRLLFWNQSLTYISQALNQTESTPPATFVERTGSLIEEIFLSGLHTQVWGSALIYYDAKNARPGSDQLAGLALGIAENLRETANRANGILLRLTGSGHGQLTRLPRLQRRMERWTDRLLALHAVEIDLTPLCFDPNRVQDFVHVQTKSTEISTVVLLVSGLQAAQLDTGDQGFATQMNHDLACLMLNCIPLSVLSEIKLNLDSSVMRTDQAAWEMDCLLERALCLDLAVPQGS